MLVVESPKRSARHDVTPNETYSYYAGYSLHFAQQLVSYLPLDRHALILDPWNGAGTTTVAAARNGYRSVGFDLNPTMVIVAKARMLRPSTFPSVLPVWEAIKAESTRVKCMSDDEPLHDWLTPATAESFRSVEQTIRKHLVAGSRATEEHTLPTADVSDLAAFFYVALFRAIRILTSPFKTSNPTWVRRPKSSTDRISCSRPELLRHIDKELKAALASHDRSLATTHADVVEYEIKLGNSEKLELADSVVDAVLTSPPYCTRIDYAVATSAELAVLGFRRKTTFESLRRSLMGTTTVPSDHPNQGSNLGGTCETLLRNIAQHESVASATYYLKNHIAYYTSLEHSFAEIARVLRPQGTATFVVQDSMYKGLHNDLPGIVEEMGAGFGLVAFQRDDFPTSVSMASINTRSRAYKSARFRPTESVISFYKQS